MKPATRDPRPSVHYSEGSRFAGEYRHVAGGAWDDEPHPPVSPLRLARLILALLAAGGLIYALAVLALGLGPGR